MSRATKHRIVTREVLNEFPEPGEDQFIVKILSPKGNNLHEAQWPTGEVHLCSMPPKFRKSVWIKRGDFVIIEEIEEGDKVKGEIVFVLYKDQIRHLKEQNFWPKEFYADHENLGATENEPKEPSAADQEEADGYETDDSDGDLDALMGENPNRPTFEEASEDETDSEEEDESD